MARKGAGGGGGGGLNTGLLFSNYILLLTLSLSAIAWIVAFIGQIVAEANVARQGVLWFAIFLQLFLILGITVVILTNSVAVSRLQLSAFLAVALVFSVFGINQGIYASSSSERAATAGYFILTICNIIWLLYFTSEEDSTVYEMLSGFGHGGLGGPGGRGSRTNGMGGGAGGMSRGTGGGGGGSLNNGSGFGGSYPSQQAVGGGGYQPTYGSGPSAADVTSKANGGGGGLGHSGSIRSGHTNPQSGTPVAGMGAGNMGRSDYSHGSDLGRTASPTSQTRGAAGTAEDGGADPTPGYGYRARALYAYQANADDPTEISFSKGEILDIVDNSGKWWQARKPNGETGIVPSNYMQVL